MTSSVDKHYMQTDEAEVTTEVAKKKSVPDPLYQVCDQKTLSAISDAIEQISATAKDNKFSRYVFSDVILSLASEVRPDLIDHPPPTFHENGFLRFRSLRDGDELSRAESIAVDVNRLDKMSPELASLKPVLAMYAHGAVLAGFSECDKANNLVGAFALTPVNNGVEHKAALDWLKTAGVLKTDVVDPQNSKVWRQEALRLFIVPKCVTSPLVSGTWLSAASKKRTVESQENAVTPSAKKQAKEPVAQAPLSEKKKAPAEKKKAPEKEAPVEKKKAEKKTKPAAEQPETVSVDDGEQKKRKASDISTAAPISDFDSELNQLMTKIDAELDEPTAAVQNNSSPQILTIIDSFDKMFGTAEQFKWNAGSHLAVFSQNLILVPNREFQMLMTSMREKQHDTEAIDKYMVAQHKENDRYTVAATQFRLPTNPLASIFSCARVNELAASHIGNAPATLTCHEKIVTIQRQAMQKYVTEDAECLRKMASGGEMAILHTLFGFLRLDRRLNGRVGPAAVLESAVTADGPVQLNQDELPMGTGFSCGPLPLQLLKKMWERYCAEIGFKRGDSPEQFMTLRAALTLPGEYAYFTKYWDESFTPTPAQVETYNSAMLPIMYSLFPPLRLGQLPTGR